MNIPLQYLTIKTKKQDKAFDFVIDDPFADGTGGGGGGSNITKLSQLENDTGFVTKTVDDLEHYYDKQTVDNKISSIPKFSIAVVEVLPADNISATTVYLVPNVQGEENLYEEYIFVEGKWERLGVQKVDLSGYYTKTEVETLVDGVEAKIPTKTSQLDDDSGFAKKSDIPTSLPASDVPDWAKQPEKPTYNKNDVGLGNVDNVKQYSANNPPPYPVTSVNGQTGAVEVEPKGTAATRIQAHNNNENSHNDIRLLIAEIRAQFNAFMDSTDEDLNQASEFIAYIKANRSLIESITTTKVNVTDIIDNLTTNVSNKPLSAKQGVQLKALIDAITVPTKLNELAEDSTHRTVTDTEKNTWNNKSDFDGDYNNLANQPTKITQFDNDAGYMKSSEQQTVIDAALQKAKNSGEFDGEDGQRGFSVLKVTTEPSSYTTATGGFTPTYRIALSTVKSQSKATEVLVGDTLAYTYYQYPIGYVDSSYVYLGARTSIRGEPGPAYTLNNADKAAIVDAVIAALSTEEWTFTLDDGTTVVKEVFIK